MIRKERKTWWALLLVAALLVGLLPTAVLAENGSAGSGVDYTVSPDADAPEQEPVEEEQEEPEEPEEEEPVEEPEEELIEDVALQMIAPLSMPRAATALNDPSVGETYTYTDKTKELACNSSWSEADINTVFPLTLGEGVKVRLKDFTLDYSAGTFERPGYSPISVAEGATATIIIEGDVTLKGGNASGTTGAAPAIHVPEGATLYIESTGERENGVPKDSLTVYGGNAAAGADGTTAAYDSYGNGYTWYGGQGGAGGGGAAPAIGGMGGKGGDAPERQAPMYNGSTVRYQVVNDGTTYIRFTGKVGSDADSDVFAEDGVPKNPSEWKFDPLPTTVNGGNEGTAGTGAGNVYITGSLTLSGSGGNSAAGGKGGDGNDGTNDKNPGSNKTSLEMPNEKKSVIFYATDENGNITNSSLDGGKDCFIFFSGGGGGGGGGGGCAAPLIGTGGAGGSSGGSGAPPTLNYFVGLKDENYPDYQNNPQQITASSTPGGAGGGGGWPNGGGGGGGSAATLLSNLTKSDMEEPGKGGASGQNGTDGSDITDNTMYSTMFGDNAGAGGKGGSSGSNGSTNTGAAGGAQVVSSYYNYTSKIYTFPAGGSGGKAIQSTSYSANSNIVLSTGVKKGTTISSGSGYAATLFGGGYGYSGVQPKVPIGIYDLADCTLTVLSRETATDSAGATTQTYTGHDYAPELYNTELFGGTKHKGLQITVSYTHVSNTLVPSDCLKPIEMETPEGTTTGSTSSYSYLKHLGITESSAAVDGHSTLINVGDTYQIKGLSSENAVSYYLTNGKAVAVGTWTDTLQIVPGSPTGVNVTAKEGNTELATNAFLTESIKNGTTPKVKLNYTWSDGTNSYDNLWKLVSKVGKMEDDNKAGDSNDTNVLYEVWSVSKDGGSPEEISRHRYTKNGTGNTVRVQEWKEYTPAGSAESTYHWEEYSESSGEVVEPEKGETGTETTTSEFQKVSTSSASYSFDKPGEYTFTLTLSGMGYATKTASFTVKVKQLIEGVTVSFSGAGKDGKKGNTQDEAWNVHPNQTMTITANDLPENVTAELTLVFPYHNTTSDNAGVFKRVVGEASAGSPFSYTPTNDLVEGQKGGTTVQVYVSNVTSNNEYYEWDLPSVKVPDLDDNSSYNSSLPTIYITMHNYAKKDGFCTVQMVNGATETTCGEYQPAETVENGGGILRIGNAGQLYWFAAYVNGDSTRAHGITQGETHDAATAELTDDINLASPHNPNKKVDSAGNTVGYEWTPIACNAGVTNTGGVYSTENAFRGAIYGGKCTISGLYISQQHDMHNGFIAVADGAVISELTLEGAMNVPSNNSGTSDDTGIGSVVGWGRKIELTDVTSKVNISGSELYHVGGLVGCTRKGSVTAASDGKSTIKGCIYAGTISLTNSTDSIGGIAGCAHWVDILYSANRGSISTTADGGSTHDDLAGGIAGQLENGSIKNCYSSEIPTQDTANKGGLIGTLRTGTTVENSVYPSGSYAIVSDESGTGNTAQEHPTLTIVSAFNTGEACYRANGNEVFKNWRQNLDNEAATTNDKTDDYPRLEREFANSEPANAAYVYQMPNKTAYSNSLPVYSVDVSWGSMLFTYQQGEWNADNHDYPNDKWEPENDDANKITITNSGDWKVNTNISFSADSAFTEKVNGTIKRGDETWSGAIIKGKKDSASSTGETAEATVELSRKDGTGTYITESEMTGTTPKKIGTVTVTITDGYAS